jgi:hypothetical protein
MLEGIGYRDITVFAILITQKESAPNHSSIIIENLLSSITLEEQNKIDKSMIQDQVWKDAENQLIKFLTDNEDKIIPMPTPMSMDICIFLKSKFILTRR